jgi:hypothetical protein
MCSLSGRTGSGSGSREQSEAGHIGETSWDEDIDFEYNVDDDYKIIRKVNSKLRLHNVFNRYNIAFETKYSSTGWTHICICPFNDHNERIPSFGYNVDEDRFHCFGCNRSGRAVQFIAYMENRSFIFVARRLIKHISSDDDDDDHPMEMLNYKELENILFDYADYVREFKKINKCSKDAIKYAEAVNWSFDMYLYKHVPSGTITLEDLIARIERLKEKLNLFAE